MALTTFRGTKSDPLAPFFILFTHSVTSRVLLFCDSKLEFWKIQVKAISVWNYCNVFVTISMQWHNSCSFKNIRKRLIIEKPFAISTSMGKMNDKMALTTFRGTKSDPLAPFFILFTHSVTSRVLLFCDSKLEFWKIQLKAISVWNYCNVFVTISMQWHNSCSFKNIRKRLIIEKPICYFYKHG